MNNWTMATTLRRAGSAILIASGVTFMLEGWSSLTSIGKFMAFMGLTSVLAVSGAYCGVRLREQKGARTFLGLAAATVAVHFSQLGAMIYSYFPVSHPSLPAFLTYTAGDPILTLALTVGASVALWSVSYLTFAAFLRSQAIRTSIVFLGLNFLLLVPDRSAMVSLLMIAGGVVVLAAFEYRCLSRDTAARTPEGAIVRALLGAPLVAILARAAFYPMPDGICGLLLLLVAAVLYGFIPFLPVSKKLVGLSQNMSVVSMFLGWFELVGFFHANPLLVGLPPAWALIGMSFSSFNSGSPGCDRRAVALVTITLASAAAGASGQDILGSAILLLNGLGLMLVAVRTREKIALTLGGFSTALGIFRLLRLALSYYSFNPWLVLAALGTTAVLGSSYLERDQKRLAASLQSLKTRFGAWS